MVSKNAKGTPVHRGWKMFLRSFNLLVFGLASLVIQCPAAIAQPYFCRVPVIQSLSAPRSPGTSDTPSTKEKSVTSDVAAYFDPLIFRAILDQIGASKPTAPVKYSLLLKNQLLNKAWRKLSSKDRK